MSGCVDILGKPDFLICDGKAVIVVACRSREATRLSRADRRKINCNTTCMSTATTGQ